MIHFPSSHNLAPNLTADNTLNLYLEFCEYLHTSNMTCHKSVYVTGDGQIFWNIDSDFLVFLQGKGGNHGTGNKDQQNKASQGPFFKMQLFVSLVLSISIV